MATFFTSGQLATGGSGRSPAFQIGQRQPNTPFFSTGFLEETPQAPVAAPVAPIQFLPPPPQAPAPVAAPAIDAAPAQQAAEQAAAQEAERVSAEEGEETRKQAAGFRARRRRKQKQATSLLSSTADTSTIL